MYKAAWGWEDGSAVRALDGTSMVKGKEWVLRLYGLHMSAMGHMHVITHN